MFNRKPWITYLLWIGLAEAVGLTAGILTREGVSMFQTQTVQPPLSPPGIFFPIVWTVLYALMGIGAARISMEEPSSGRSKGLNLFILQLSVNFLWPLFFFNRQAYGFSLLWLILLWLLVLAMILQFRKTDKTAAWLQLPYLLWLTFALYLNAGVWLLNR